ncbi:type IV secretion system protein [Asticcacaulis sp. AC460]|uniref:type IV secretion system protein n=1 Tax=Asticcacaulis sp. AC460 TaxID=1282360 RepID=UPI0004CFC2A8|nr:type IV secretion system protein [Asticcacaulis sp. AC460]
MMLQAGACRQITLVGETSVSGSLAAMDCHINAAVKVGYDRLFGAGGAFGYALTTMLVIYVAIIAYGFLTGRTQLTVTMMSPRIITMVLVLTFVTMWPAYHAVFYGLFMGGPDEVAAALLGHKGSAVMNFAQNLDGLFVRFAHIARTLDGPSTVATTTAQQPELVAALIQSKSMPVTLFWLSGLFLLCSTLGVLILTRLTLYLLLILGPIFIVLALFPQTRGLFNGWIRTTLIFALAPLLTVLGGTAALMLFVPLIDAIAEDPQRAVQAVQPMVILFMGSLIYSAFLFTLMWVAGSLVRDWQAALRDTPNVRGNPQPAPAAPSQQVAMFADASGRSVNDAYLRTEPLITAVTRDGAGGGGQGGAASANTRSEGLGLYDPQARSTSGDRFTRVQGLGQRFRDRTSPTGTPPAASRAAPSPSPGRQEP